MLDENPSSADLRWRAEQLIERLSLEFPNEPAPDRFPPKGSLDTKEIDEALGGWRWDELEDSRVAGIGWLSCFAHFNDDQARYYLPAFLRYPSAI